MTQIQAVLVGAGLIGNVLKARIQSEPGWQLSQVVQIGGIQRADGTTVPFDGVNPDLTQVFPKGTDVAFIAIPTFDDGATAAGYIAHCVEHGIVVVTCEKGSLSHHFKTLEPHLGKIGYSATVGGGTRMLGYLRGRSGHTEDAKIDAVVNGTLNYVFDEIARKGRSFEEAMSEAKRLGYAEPGANDPLKVIAGEIQDTVMKAIVIFNMCLKKTAIMTPKDVVMRDFGPEQMTRLIQEASNRRYVVSFTRESGTKTEDILGGFSVTADGWVINAGFYRIDAMAAGRDWLPQGVDNALLVREGPSDRDGVYTLTGPGAGPYPTTGAMMQDARELLKRRV